MTDADILRKAREIYAAAPSHAPSGAIPALGTYCVYTALDAASVAECRKPASCTFVFDYFVAACSTASVIDFNATHSTEEVLAVFDRAIESAEAA